MTDERRDDKRLWGNMIGVCSKNKTEYNKKKKYIGNMINGNAILKKQSQKTAEQTTRKYIDIE